MTSQREPLARWSRRTGVAAGAAIATAVMAAGPAIAAAPVYPYHADLRGGWGTTCPVYSYTDGSLQFFGGRAAATGVVGAEASADLCPVQWHPEFTFAEFTAYSGRTRVDYETAHIQPVSVGGPWQVASRYDVTLASSSADIPIDRVEVRACREAGTGLPAFVCGEPVTVTPVQPAG